MQNSQKLPRIAWFNYMKPPIPSGIAEEKGFPKGSVTALIWEENFPQHKCCSPKGKSPIHMLQLWGEGFPNGGVTTFRGRLPQWKCYNSEMKGFLCRNVASLRGKASLAVRSQEHQKVTPHNKPHTRDLLGETQNVAASAQMRSSRERSMRQAYTGFLGGGIFQGRDWWDFKSWAWLEPKDWWILCSGTGRFW